MIPTISDRLMQPAVGIYRIRLSVAEVIFIVRAVFLVAATVAGLATALARPGAAQHHALQFNVESSQDELLVLYLPKIAVASDGSYGIAAEGLFRTSTGREVLKVLAQRFSATGAAVGPTHVFEGESCSSLDIWLSDYMERPEVAFHPNGAMLVLMQHTGEFQIGSDGVRSAEATLGGIDGSGQMLDLAPQYTSCVQHKFIFVGGGRQDRPRFDLAPSGEVFLTLDGFFGGSALRNVAIRVLDAEGNELIEEVVPHADVNSEESFHMYPDIATNGSLMLSAWHRCPVIDNQGNAEECDVEVQFGSISQAGLQAVGVNQRVNVGDPLGTINMYPAVAMNAAGQSVVAWADGRDGPHGEIYSQRFDAQGQPVGANLKVSAGEGSIDARPEVAILADGRFMVAWMDSSNAGYRARARNYDAAGNPQGSPFELVPGIVSGEPSVAADGDNFAIVYLTIENGAVALGSNKSSVFTSAEDVPRPLSGTFRAEVYPNPIGSQASISLELYAAEHVVIRLFDVLGREVARVLEGPREAGRHLVPLDTSQLTSGAYFLDLQVGERRQTLSVLRAR